MRTIGKLFRIALNTIKPVAKGSAKVGQTGWKAFINGSQTDLGSGILFKGGLKHKILQIGYPNAVKNFHNIWTSGYATTAQVKSAYDKIPNCLHQAARELSDLMSYGVKI